MDYLFTIIIPHKNIPHLLSRCLSSIPDRSDIQVIVIDDASDSTDEVKNVCSQYENTELLLTNDNCGAGFARNKGLERAEGKWILFADADDFFSPHLLDLITNHYTDKADIVYFGSESIYSESLAPSPKLDNRKKALKKYSSSPRRIEEFCRYYQTEPWGKMIKRSLIEKHHVRFDETPLANDFYFSVATGYFAETIAFDNQTIYMYTEREGSLSHKYSGDGTTVLTRLKVYKHVQDFFDEHKIPYAPFYRYSLSEYLNKESGFSDTVKDFWDKNSISFIKVLFRYTKDKLYQYTFGVHL